MHDAELISPRLSWFSPFQPFPSPSQSFRVPHHPSRLGRETENDRLVRPHCPRILIYSILTWLCMKANLMQLGIQCSTIISMYDIGMSSLTPCSWDSEARTSSTCPGASDVIADVTSKSVQSFQIGSIFTLRGSWRSNSVRAEASPCLPTLS